MLFVEATTMKSHGSAAGLVLTLAALAASLLTGILFGLMAYKPQFGLMIPIALAAGGYWRSFAAAAATAVLLTLAEPDLVRALVLEAPAAIRPKGARPASGTPEEIARMLSGTTITAEARAAAASLIAGARL